LFGRVGHRFAANVTGSGKLLLAFLPDEQLDTLLADWHLEKRTEQTVADPAVLRSQLAAIRERGWSENLNETEMGIASVAAPIRNGQGDVVAAISVVLPTQQLSGNALKRLARPTIDAGIAISRRLGYRPTPDDRETP
jgi:IclR family KDG regulon transcriptional repressor